MVFFDYFTRLLGMNLTQLPIYVRVLAFMNTLLTEWWGLVSREDAIRKGIAISGESLKITYPEK